MCEELRRGNLPVPISAGFLWLDVCLLDLAPKSTLEKTQRAEHIGWLLVLHAVAQWRNARGNDQNSHISLVVCTVGKTRCGPSHQREKRGRRNLRATLRPPDGSLQNQIIAAPSVLSTSEKALFFWPSKHNTLTRALAINDANRLKAGLAL